MNPTFLFEKKSRLIVPRGDVKSVKLTDGDGQCKGLRMMNGASFRMNGIRRFSSFRSMPEQVGWEIRFNGRAKCVVKLLGAHNRILSRTVYSSGDSERHPVRIEWPNEPTQRIDMVIGVSSKDEKGWATLVTNRLLERNWLLDLAKGRGLEIGPGNNPQIFPSDEIDVSYVEQMEPEKWNALYNARGGRDFDRSLWKNYVVGNASTLPVEDGSLDFIFASHVFEHLVNPLGHLRRWHEKLKPGGLVLLIVPDLNGTGDLLQIPSTLAELVTEEEIGLWEPRESHYMRFHRAGPEDDRVRQDMADKSSIHTHFYDNRNMARLMDHVVETLDFSTYMIRHTPNHKDFYVVLEKVKS